MKKFALCLIPSVLLLLVSCAGKSETPETVKLLPFSPENEQKSLELATDLVNGFVKAVQSGDVKTFQEQLPPKFAASMTPERFKKMCEERSKRLGKLEGAVYLGTLQNGNLRDNFWKLRFVKDGKILEIPYLVRMYRGNGGELEILGFGMKVF